MAEERPALCRYADGQWHIIHDDGSQGLCGKYTRHCSEEKIVPTCEECLELRTTYKK